MTWLRRIRGVGEGRVESGGAAELGREISYAWSWREIEGVALGSCGGERESAG